MERLRIAVLPLDDAKSFQNDLAKEGVEIVLNHNTMTCTRGCSITVEVLGYEKDLPKIFEVYEAAFKRLAQDHDVNWEVVNAIFDSSKETAICPACATEFTTTMQECPECGLFLG